MQHVNFRRPRCAHRKLPNICIGGRRTLPALVILCVPRFVRAQIPTTNPASGEATQTYLREFYPKYEYMVPMRDGIQLFTVVYAPSENSRPPCGPYYHA